MTVICKVGKNIGCPFISESKICTKSLIKIGDSGFCTIIDPNISQETKQNMIDAEMEYKKYKEQNKDDWAGYTE